jgi:hypothetical protein
LNQPPSSTRFPSLPPGQRRTLALCWRGCGAAPAAGGDCAAHLSVWPLARLRRCAGDGDGAAAPLGLVAPTFTPTTEASPTPSPSATASPTPSPTPTATPATAAAWAEDYFASALEALATLAAVEFSPQRAAALLPRLAQNRGLTVASVSYRELGQEPWAALVTPFTPDGEPLPMLFWRNEGAGGQIQGQQLRDLLPALRDGAPLPLTAGLAASAVARDVQGRYHLLMVERPEAGPQLSAWLWSQPQLGSPFVPVWRSADDPNWRFPAASAQVELTPNADGRLLPDLLIRSPLPATARCAPRPAHPPSLSNSRPSPANSSSPAGSRPWPATPTRTRRRC